MLVKKNIKDETYQKLINYAYSKCDTVRFITRNDGLDEKQKYKLKSLENNLLRKLKKDFICVSEDPEWLKYNDYPSNLYYLYHFYHFSDEMKNYLLTNKNLYAWLNPNYPEDISFFKDGYCLLYSVAHENLCNIYCENEKEYKYLKLIGVNF